MPYLLNLLYLLALLLAAPWLIYKAITTGKYRRGLLCKFLGLTPIRKGMKPCAWFHAVSVGEVLLLRQVVARFRQRRPEWQVVLSTTTNTGLDVAKAQYPDLSVFYWPFDFTWAVHRALRRTRPALIVLAELELWPNFLAAARARRCRVAVVNGRMSERSHRGYGRLRPLVRTMLKRVDCFAVQNAEYRDRLLDLGADRNRLFITGSVKFDGVSGERGNAKTRQLAELFQIKPHSDLVWIAGSTQAPEEQVTLDIYHRAKNVFPNLRLILVPRHKERFDEVANLVAASALPLVRRSRLTQPLTDRHAVILLDTLGELGAAWGLADVAFVGGSLGNRGGQNMLEPAAYGAAVTIGPNTSNFRDIVEQLLARQAAIQVGNPDELERVTIELLADASERQRLGDAARAYVQSQQGAAERTLELLDRLITRDQRAAQAA